MPDSTTINYLDLMRNGIIPVKIEEFKHYITPEDTSRYNPITMKVNTLTPNKYGYKKSPEEGATNFQTFTRNNRGRFADLLDNVGRTGLLGGLAVGHFAARHPDVYDFTKSK